MAKLVAAAMFAGAEARNFSKGFVRMPRNGPVDVAEITNEMRASVPKSLDWTTQGATTPVKDQGDCGSCWAFSATAGIESGLFMATNQLVKLSEQQVISCDKEDDACDGGDLPSAFHYVKKNGGIDSEADYPGTSYKHGKDGKCDKKKAKKHVAKITGYKYAVPPCEKGSCKGQDESGLMAALAAHGPLSVCVNAEWDSYDDGILTSKCPGGYNDLDHCVQLVGYDNSGSHPYWKLRNSWDDDWGEKGYIRIAMGSNMCGIADEAMFVTASLSEADEIAV